MEGAARAAQSRADEATALAWHIAKFNAASQAGQLKSLKHYLSKQPARRAQSPADMLEALKTLKASGAPINIRKAS